MKTILEVLNVKQGDCLILHPREYMYDKEAFVVDTGNGMHDFSERISNDENYNLILTHAHTDHTNGVNYLLLKPSLLVRMKSLILPEFHNESVLIAMALLKLRGMKELSDKWGLRWQLNQIIANQKILINIGQSTQIKFVKDGDSLCNHMSVLNPQQTFKDYLTKMNDDEIELFAEMFDERISSEIETFLRMSKNNFSVTDTPLINSLFIRHNNNSSMLNRANYFIGYMMENRQAISDFNAHPTSIKLLGLIKKKNDYEHTACLVFKYNYQERGFLFGGDAACSVWERLILEKKDITAYYFKIPHHGSKKTLVKVY